MIANSIDIIEKLYDKCDTKGPRLSLEYIIS